MAEYSYVTVDVRKSDEALAIIERTDFVDPFEYVDDSGDTWVQVEIAEARYGFPEVGMTPSGPYVYGDDEIHLMVEELRSAGIEFTASDDGGMEWSGREFHYLPETGTTYTRFIDATSGEPVLTRSQYQRLVGPDGENFGRLDVAEAIEAHFGDDPRGWL